MQQQHGNSPISPGTMLLVAGGACLLGSLTPVRVAIIIAASLLVIGVIAFALRRGNRTLEAILAEELSSPRTAKTETSSGPPTETDFVRRTPQQPVVSERGQSA